MKLPTQIELLEKTWKSGLAVLTALTLVLGGLFLNLTSTSAHGTPNMTVNALVSEVENPNQGWVETLNTQAGRTVKFDIEIHNTVVGTNAHNVRARVNLPSGVSTSHNIPVTVTAENANSASDSVTVNVTSPAQGAEIRYVPGSSRLTWDENGDSVLDYNQTPIPDDIVSGSGVRIGDQSGCNEFIIKIHFLASLVAEEPEPPPPPPPAGGQEQNQNQNQTQNNNQTVNVTQSQTINDTAPVVPAVAGAKIPVKQPETGIGVLGAVMMGSLAPLGIALSRYGRGRVNTFKREENLSELAHGLVDGRVGKSNEA